MNSNQREILIYYNPDSSSDRKTVAYAQTVCRHIKSYAFDRAHSTGTTWQRILDALDLDPRLLLNKADPYYQTNIRGRDFDRESWIKILQHNPYLIKAPIAVRGEKAVFCTTPTDIFKLEDENCGEPAPPKSVDEAVV